MSAQLVSATMVGNAALALQRSDAFITGTNAHSFIVKIGGRKGTRSYDSDSAGAATKSKDADASAEEARTGRLASCMASWDSNYVAAVKALLGFVHKVGFARFNAAPLIKLRKAPRKTSGAFPFCGAAAIKVARANSVNPMSMR